MEHSVVDYTYVQIVHFSSKKYTHYIVYAIMSQPFYPELRPSILNDIDAYEQDINRFDTDYDVCCLNHVGCEGELISGAEEESHRQRHQAGNDQIPSTDL